MRDDPPGLTRRSFLAAPAAWTVASDLVAQERRDGGPPPREVGINLAGIEYWTAQFPFSDLMKSSGGWAPELQDKGHGGTLELRPDGYPARLERGQSARTPLAWDNGNGYPAGRYVARWDGEGRIAFPISWVKVLSDQPGRIVVDVDSRTQLWVAITETNPGNPIRNLRVLWPGTEPTHASQPFNPEFLRRLAPFKALRFMDWGRTNGSNVVAWSDRARIEDVTYSRRGVPVERMIDLANALQADPWLCVPHRADDDYVRQLALLVKGRLDPRRKVYLEYSNEVWNRSFEQAGWALEQARRKGLPTPSEFGSAFYAERSVEIFALFRDAFGADAPERVVRVIGGQAVWTQFQGHALGWKDTARHADALAIAPYFKAERASDPAHLAETLAATPEALIEQMLASVRGGVRTWVAQNAALARKHRLALVAYEGGAHDTAAHFPAEQQGAVTELLKAAHRHPRMRDVYAEYLATWADAGGRLFNQYYDIGIFAKWGLWGLLESVTQDVQRAPKYQGVLDFIEGRAAGRK